jgi:hypothetical protein
MSFRKLTRSIAAGAATIAVAIGGYAIVNSNAGNTSGTASAAPHAQSAHGGPSPAGEVPQNWSPGTGTVITGAAADNAKAVAVAKYPGGTVNRVLQLSDGSYAVHRIGTPAPHHVFVNKDFKVTGTA